MTKDTRTIIAHRFELKKELAELLNETISVFDVEDVIDTIYEDEENDDEILS
mgnify:CR=1 FL=1